MKKIAPPAAIEYAYYYQTYLDKVAKDIHVLDELKKNAKNLVQLYKSLDKEKLLYRYELGKWSMKDIMMHLIDVERVFTYRAMRFARKDKEPLPFFDENEFAKNAQADKISTSYLLKEYQATRNATLTFFNNLNAEQLKRQGMASRASTSVRACIWIIYAHELHHQKMIEKHYL